MQKLPLPSVKFSTAVAEAIAGIGGEDDRRVHTIALKDSDVIEETYEKYARSANLCSLPRVTGRGGDPVVHGTLKKSQLINLYSKYFLPEGKPARRLYEAIKVISGGKCPLCGGVGHVRTLDHYLPKANFPLYSIMPMNLVPSCRDCNTEKLNAFANTQREQTLHPYFDDDKFFNEKWIYARVIPTTPPVLDFFVQPPVDWHDDDKSRVRSHFNDYNLAGKFSVEAAADLPETIQTRKTTMRLNSPEDFSQYLNEKGKIKTLPINNWRRVMFAALASDEWFCSQTFA